MIILKALFRILTITYYLELMLLPNNDIFKYEIMFYVKKRLYFFILLNF